MVVIDNGIRPMQNNLIFLPLFDVLFGEHGIDMGMVPEDNLLVSWPVGQLPKRGLLRKFYNSIR